MFWFWWMNYPLWKRRSLTSKQKALYRISPGIPRRIQVYLVYFTWRSLKIPTFGVVKVGCEGRFLLGNCWAVNCQQNSNQGIYFLYDVWHPRHTWNMDTKGTPPPIFMVMWLFLAKDACLVFKEIQPISFGELWSSDVFGFSDFQRLCFLFLPG